jgi:hypothetical protein
MAWYDFLTNNAGSLLNAGVNLYSASQAADAQQALANQQTAAGQQAAEMAAFRPVGVTTRFGTSGFQYDDQGRLVGAGYQVAPDVAAQREALLGLSGGSLAQVQGAQAYMPQYQQAAQGLFNLGQQYLSESPEAAAAKVMTQQQGLLAPQREQQLANIRNQLQQTGRSGLATGATASGGVAGGLAATNPEMAAYYNAIAQQDAQLAANAQQQAQQQINFGQGLFGAGSNLLGQGYGLQTQALAPWQGYLSGAQTLEGLGQQALTTGTSLGSSQAAAGAQAGNLLSTSQRYAAPYASTAANTQQAALSGLTNTLSNPIAQLIGSLTSPSNTGYGLGWGSYDTSYLPAGWRN